MLFVFTFNSWNPNDHLCWELRAWSLQGGGGGAQSLAGVWWRGASVERVEMIWKCQNISFHIGLATPRYLAEQEDGTGLTVRRRRKWQAESSETPHQHQSLSRLLWKRKVKKHVRKIGKRCAENYYWGERKRKKKLRMITTLTMTRTTTFSMYLFLNNIQRYAVTSDF